MAVFVCSGCKGVPCSSQAQRCLSGKSRTQIPTTAMKQKLKLPQRNLQQLPSPSSAKIHQVTNEPRPVLVWGVPMWWGAGTCGERRCPRGCWISSPADFSLFSYNNGVVMMSCRDLDSTRSALSATSAFAIATAGANEGTPTKEKYRRMSLASAGTCPRESAFGVPISTVPRWVSLQAHSGPEEPCWGSPEPPELSACSRPCPGSLGMVLPQGCAGYRWPQVSHCLLTQQLRGAREGSAPLAALQQL